MYSAWRFLSMARETRASSLRISYLGDSLVEQPLPTWPDYMVDADPNLSASVSTVNYGVNGARASALVTGYAAGAHLNRPTNSADEAWFFLHAGGNDIADGVSAATTYGYLTSLWASARTDGYRVVALTILPRTAWGSGSQAIADALNSLITGTPSLYDEVVLADQVLPTPGNTDWYYDGTHPTELGSQMIAEAVVAVLQGG